MLILTSIFAAPVPEWVVLFVTLAMYVTLTVCYRWYEAALPIRNHLRAEWERAFAVLRVARGHLADGADPEDRAVIRAACRLLRQARKIVPERRRLRERLWDALTWSRGEEVEMLHCIRNAERLLVRFDSLEAVRERLLLPPALLGDPETGDDEEWKRSMDSGTAKTRRLPSRVKRCRKRLDERLRLVHEREILAVDDNLTEIMRSSWIMFLCVGMMLACGILLHHAVLFLAGAVGGLIGRMARVTQVEETSRTIFADTRAAKLIASPALGAVAGWTGVLLVSVSGLQILGEKQIWTRSDQQVEAFAMALLLGCSEPLLNRVLSNASRRDTGAAGQGATGPRASARTAAG